MLVSRIWLTSARVFALALLSVLLVPIAQEVRAQALDGYVMERAIRDRWMHGRQLPEFTEFEEGSAWIHLDSVRRAPDTMARDSHIFHLIVRRAALRFPGTLLTGPGGRTVRYMVGEWQRGFPIPIADTARARRSSEGILFRGYRGPLELPESVGWDFVPTFHPASPQPGATWVDTLDRTAARMGFTQSLSGVRASMILRDTVVAGRTLWVVRDSMPARYAERWTRMDWSLEAEVETRRRAEGVVLGTHLYDPELGLFVARWDTTRLVGEAVRTLPDGREFRTPAVYEATREWTLHNLEAYEAKQAELRVARNRTWTGPVIMRARDPAEKRRQWDSLEAVFLAAPDRPARIAAFKTLRRSGPTSPAQAFDLRSYALQIGDTTAAVAITMRRRLDVRGFRLLLPFLNDPGVLLDMQMPSGGQYNDLAMKIGQDPPVLVPDTSRWPCTPEACRMLAAQADVGAEPRLRDLALLMNLTLAPREWYDHVVQRAEDGSVLAKQARALAEGATTWYNQTVPAPGPEASWREWMGWAGAGLQVLSSGRRALRLYEIRTDVSVAAAFRQRLTEAPSDSARLVYGMLLLALDEADPTPDEVTANLDAGSEALTTLAHSQLARLLSRNSAPADEQTARELTDALLEHLLLGAPIWPGTPDRWNPGREERRVVGGNNRSATPQMLLTDSLPPGLAEKWASKIDLMTRDEWTARSDLLPGELIDVGPVVRAGPFARVSVGWSGRMDRRDVGTPYAWSASQTFYLRQVGDKWIYVTGSSMIT